MCKKKGILPFAKLARNAFIAKKILGSFVELKKLSKNSYYNILGNLSTVSNDYIFDHKNIKKNRNFLKRKYYHLRPNSYDILNKRYKSEIKSYELKKDELNHVLNLDLKELKYLIKNTEEENIKNLLKKNKFNFNTKHLINFCMHSLKLRENYKFLFTRTLSDAIELLRLFSKKRKTESFFK